VWDAHWDEHLHHAIVGLAALAGAATVTAATLACLAVSLATAVEGEGVGGTDRGHI